MISDSIRFDQKSGNLNMVHFEPMIDSIQAPSCAYFELNDGQMA